MATGNNSLLERVATRQSELSQTANALKARLDHVRFACFALSIGGASLAAIASGLPNDTYRNWLTWPAAAMLAISAFVTARILGRESVMLLVKARMASEALKREAFLYATSAPPYADAATQDGLLRGALDTIENKTDGLGLYELKATGPGSLSARAARCCWLHRIKIGWPDSLLPKQRGRAFEVIT